MIVKGYKAFNKDLTNRYGKQFEEGKTYEENGELKYGTNGCGIHFCKRLEDTIRYFNPYNIKIAEVTALGDVISTFDNYNDYYDLCVTNKIRIDKVLTREEIVDKFKNNSYHSVTRFLSQFPLLQEEINYFKEKYKDNEEILDIISYYQENDKEVYKRKVFQKSKGV